MIYPEGYILQKAFFKHASGYEVQSADGGNDFSDTLLPFCKRIHRHLVLEIFSGCRLDMGEGSAGTFISKVNAREEINVTIDITTKMVYSHCKQKHYNKLASEFP